MERINKIAGYRAMLLYTQKEMANILGITPQAYSKKERGKVSFNDKEKVIIKNVFVKRLPNITIEELFF